MEDGREVIQIETPVSMTIQNFSNPHAILVPRQRYRPVHNTSHLLQVQSDLYILENGYFVMNPKRIPPTEPLIKLGDSFHSVKKTKNFFLFLKEIFFKKSWKNIKKDLQMEFLLF